MYIQSVVNDIEDIPPLVKNFAADNGWTVSNVCDLVRPGGGETITLAAGRYTHPDDATPPRGVHRYFDISVAGVYRMTTRSYLPRLNGLAATGWDAAKPTRVHLIGGVERGSSYIIAVVEIGFNLYRHLYIGNMVKHGTYTGGECISTNGSTQFYKDAIFYPVNAMRANPRTKFLFGCCFEEAADYPGVNENSVPDRRLRTGGVKVLHADNPNTWRRFSNIRNGSGLIAQEVSGGFGDGQNDYAVAKAFCPFAGAAVLVTPNLWCSFAPQDNKASNRYVPIGHPAGARMVNMRDLQPGAEISVGAQTWRVFPEFSKRDDWQVPKSADGYAAYESSGYNGYAYLVA